jgi:hypothetical protein
MWEWKEKEICIFVSFSPDESDEIENQYTFNLYPPYTEIPSGYSIIDICIPSFEPFDFSAVSLFKNGLLVASAIPKSSIILKSHASLRSLGLPAPSEKNARYCVLFSDFNLPPSIVLLCRKSSWFDLASLPSLPWM